MPTQWYELEVQPLRPGAWDRCKVGDGIGIFICRDLDYALRLCAYIKRSCRTVDMRLRLSGRQSHDSGKDRNHEVDRIRRDSTGDAEGDCK